MYPRAALVLYVFAHFSNKLRMRSPFIWRCVSLASRSTFQRRLTIFHSSAPRVPMLRSLVLLRGSYLRHLRYFLDSMFRRLGNNLSGHYKRGIVVALHVGIGNFSAAMASNFYWSRDAPRYILGRECNYNQALYFCEIDSLELMSSCWHWVHHGSYHRSLLYPNQ